MKTTRIFTLPLLLASSAVLTACGGGSDSSDTGGTGGNNTVALSASVVQSTVCNTTVPASTAELIVYDNNWAIKSRHKADASGKINASIPKTDYVNISFVGTDGVGSARRIDINTFAQHPVGDLGVFRIAGASNQGCECQITDVSVTSVMSSLNSGAMISGHNTRKPVSQNYTNYNTVDYYDVEICRAVGDEWPTLYAATRDAEPNKAAGYLSGYNPTTPLTIFLDQSPTSYSANFDQAIESATILHNFGDAYLAHSELYPSSDIQLFDSIPGLTTFSLRGRETSYEYAGDVEIRLGRYQRNEVVPPYADTIDVTLPNAEGPSELARMIILWLNSDDDNYDLSTINDFETFSIGLSARLTDGSGYYQTFIGPKLGTIPNDPLPADYGVEALIEESDITIFASMLRYGDQQSYLQYLQSNIAASKLPISERQTGNRRQFNQISIEFNF
ncbi:MAG: hypothetical protein KKE94_04845 [Gammaproteobacteria bacterium]|nr:hypothetical protein [Gammaproteobacteria bacterium]